MMKVELVEYPKGIQRFEITLGGMLYIISLEEGKKLADWIYILHPVTKAETELFVNYIRDNFADDPWLNRLADRLMLTQKDEGFFCPKCGTVYEPEIMACRICDPETYASLVSEKNDVSDS
jgi:hypothetical protein